VEVCSEEKDEAEMVEHLLDKVCQEFSSTVYSQVLSRMNLKHVFVENCDATDYDRLAEVSFD